MVERLVDVLLGHTVLHTYPITLEDSPNTHESHYTEKALQAAAYDHLVPNEERERLTTRMHVSRSGPLAREGDDKGTLSQTKQGLNDLVRARAYRLWQADGEPAGQADRYWELAWEQHLRERAYFLWKQEGCPEGRSDEHWHRTREFEKY